MLSTDNNKQFECPVCFNEELSSPQFVYSACCYQKVCDVCDKTLSKCPQCRTELGELRIRFGGPFDMKNSSKLRLLPAHNTAGSVISTVKRLFPSTETQCAHPPFMRYQNFTGPDGLVKFGQPVSDTEEITSEREYYLENVRSPHERLTDNDVDGWIVALLWSGDKLIARATKEEIHRKCNIYADKFCSSGLSQEYINSRIESLVKRGYCELNRETDTYHYRKA